jgi:hypothetical protein
LVIEGHNPNSRSFAFIRGQKILICVTLAKIYGEFAHFFPIASLCPLDFSLASVVRFGLVLLLLSHSWGFSPRNLRVSSLPAVAGGDILLLVAAALWPVTYAFRATATNRAASRL